MSANETFKNLRKSIIPMNQRNCDNCAHQGDHKTYTSGRNVQDWPGTGCEDCTMLSGIVHPDATNWKNK